MSPLPGAIGVEMFKDRQGRTWIAVSELAAAAWCETQLKWRWAGVRPLTAAMTAGKKLHEQAEKEFERSTADTPAVEAAEALARAKAGENFVGREVPIYARSCQLYGRIDEVHVGPERILIIDDKPAAFIRATDRVQLLGYAVAWAGAHRDTPGVYAAARCHASGHLIWAEKLTEISEQLIAQKIARLRALAERKMEFAGPDKITKCDRCVFRNVCAGSAT